MTQDCSLFPSPETFNPDRFLNSDDPRLVDFTLPFGFGRRICPGMYVANQTIFIIVARCVSAAFTPANSHLRDEIESFTHSQYHRIRFLKNPMPMPLQASAL